MAQRRRKSNTRAHHDYEIEGSAVRKAAPQRYTRERESLREERRLRERERDLRREKRRAKKNRERALALSPAYVAFLSVCICVTFLVCGCYVFLQSQITNRINSVSSLQSEILDMKTQNEEAKQKIETSVDLNAIREKAINELGMVYPDSSQIIYYDTDNEDSMTQYSTDSSK